MSTYVYCRIFTKNQGCCCLSYTIEEDRPKDNMQICCFIVTIHLHTIVHLCISFIPSSLSLSLVIWRARFLKHLDCWQDMYIGTSQAHTSKNFSISFSDLFALCGDTKLACMGKCSAECIVKLRNWQIRWDDRDTSTTSAGICKRRML